MEASACAPENYSESKLRGLLQVEFRGVDGQSKEVNVPGLTPTNSGKYFKYIEFEEASSQGDGASLFGAVNVFFRIPRGVAQIEVSAADFEAKDVTVPSFSYGVKK